MDRVLARDTTLDARDPDALPDVLSAEERHFLPAKPVAVHNFEKQPIPSVHRWNDSEEPFDLCFREVGKLMRGLTTDDVHSVSLSCVGRDLDVFTHFHELKSVLRPSGFDGSSQDGRHVGRSGEAVPVVGRACAVAFVLACLTAPLFASELIRDTGPYRQFAADSARSSRRVMVAPEALGPSFSFSIGSRRFEVRDADIEFASERPVTRHAVVSASSGALVVPDAPLPGDMVVRFDLEDSPYGGSTITVHRGIVFATLALREGLFTLAPRRDGAYMLSPLGDHECDVVLPAAVGLPEPGAVPGLWPRDSPFALRRSLGQRTGAAAADLPVVSHASGRRRRVARHPSPYVHVHRHMLVYSDGMLSLFGGHDSVKAFFEHTMNVQNTVNQDTGGLATVRDELAAAVYIEKAPYDGIYWSDALHLLVDDPQVVALSTELQAPLVGFWDLYDRAGGIAYQYNGGNWRKYGFYVVAFSRARYEAGGEFQTPHHEIGHAKGLAHDRYVDPQDYFFAGNHAFVDCAAGLSDVMAYGGSQCTTTRLLRYSNRDVPLQGVNPPFILGSEDSNGAAVLRLTASDVPKFVSMRTADF